MTHTDLPLSYGISSLAMSGFTALLGMQDICLAKPGDRALISGAAGESAVRSALLLKP